MKFFKRDMKFVFFGTPEFAAIVLEKLVKAGLPPAFLVCNPDRPSGRKKTLTPPPAKLAAERHKVRIYQPERLDAEIFKREIGNADFALVAAYGKIIPQSVITLFPKGIVGIHPSLLPRHRGPSPIQTAILEGDAQTGVTLYRLDEQVDHGPILAQKTLYENLDTINYPTLLVKLAELAGEMLAEFIPAYTEYPMEGTPQDETKITYTKKFGAEDAYVSPEDLQEARDGADREKAERINRIVRALNPEPGTWTTQNGRRMKILETGLEGGKLVLKKIQFEGKKPQIL